MVSFQSVMQRQMEATASIVVSSQPMVVPTVPQDPPPESSPVADLPAPVAVQEVVVSSPVPRMESSLPLATAPSLHRGNVSLVPSLQPSMWASSHRDSSFTEGDCVHWDPFECSALEGFTLQSIGSTLGPRPSAATFSQHDEYLWLMLRTGAMDGNRPRNLQKDKAENMYC